MIRKTLYCAAGLSSILILLLGGVAALLWLLWLIWANKCIWYVLILIPMSVVAAILEQIFEWGMDKIEYKY